MKKKVIKMHFRFVNLWKYWGKKYNCRDLSLIDIDLYSELSGTRIIILNVGFIIRWKKW